MDAATTNNNDDEVVAEEFPPFIRIYKSGRIERFLGTDVVPPSVDPATGVASKDVIIDPETPLSARLFLPPNLSTSDNHQTKKKLPILVYYHGGGFVIESAFSPGYHNYVTSLVARANVLAISVNYRLAPEHPLPAAYDDAWAALLWVVGSGSDPWVSDHGDLGRVFFAGDSAGANIAHHVAMRAGGAAGGVEIGSRGAKIEGIVLTHPFFWGSDPVGEETKDPETRAGVEKMWKFVSPATAAGIDDHTVNPTAETAPSMAGIGCGRVLVCVAEKDFLSERGKHYCEVLRRSGWNGDAEMLVSEGENHVFHLFDPSSQRALEKMDRVVSFINGGEEEEEPPPRF